MNDIAEASELKFLGSISTSKNEVEGDIEIVIGTNNTSFYSLIDIMRKRSMSRASKLKIYNTIIIPVLTDRCEM